MKKGSILEIAFGGVHRYGDMWLSFVKIAGDLRFGSNIKPVELT